jgi:hypothetical protein
LECPDMKPPERSRRKKTGRQMSDKLNVHDRAVC